MSNDDIDIGSVLLGIAAVGVIGGIVYWCCCSSSEDDGEGDGAVVINEPPPSPLYVIIGKGFTAVHNHATLRKSDWGIQRLTYNNNLLPVLHVGHDDPWRHYHRHHMGQFPHLLGLPGFSERYVGQPDNEPLSSTTFGDTTFGVFNTLLERDDVNQLNNWVALIERHDQRASPESLDALKKPPHNLVIPADHEFLQDFDYEHTPYRLLLVNSDGETRCLYATKVDICTGTGPNRMMMQNGSVIGNPANAITQETYTSYKEAFDQPWVPLENYRDFKFMMSGQHAMYNNFPLADANSHVCISGTGGIGVNLVEVCLEGAGTVDNPTWDARWVDWMATNHHRFTAFPPSLRNDPLAHPDSLPAVAPQVGCIHRYTTLANRADNNNHFIARPGWDHLRFGIGVGIKTADQNTDSITFGQNDRYQNTPLQIFSSTVQDPIGINAGTYVFDYERQVAAPPSNEYHQLFYTAGFSNNAGDVGSARFLTAALGTAAPINPQEDDRFVGLQFNDVGNDVRVLGISAWVFPAAGGNNVQDTMLQYIQSLPIQLQVGPPNAPTGGVSMNALSVALANQFFNNAFRNKNLNTATRAELVASGLDDSIAGRVIALRASHPSGYSNIEHLYLALAADGGVDVGADTFEHLELDVLYAVPPVDL